MTMNPNNRKNHSVEAEMSVLGTMLLSEGAAQEAVGALRAENFYRPSHQVVFKAMAGLVEANRPLDIVSVAHALGEAGLDAIGGTDFLSAVDLYVPSAANSAGYIQIVKDEWTRRDMEAKARKLMALCQDPAADLADVRAYASVLEQMPTGVGSPFVLIGDVEIGEETGGVSTGWRELDTKIDTGGYPKGQMTVVRAYHKGGKSTFKASSAVRLAEQGLKVGYAVFADLNRQQLKRRVMRQLTKWSKRPLRDLNAAADFDDALQAVMGWDMWVYDAADLDDGTDIETFAAWLKAAHAKHGFDVFFLDYAQEITSRDPKAYNEIAEANIVARKVNNLARRTGLPLVVGSQITEGKDGEKAKTKYSRAWEEKAGWVMTLEREAPETVNLTIDYSRFGAQGTSLKLFWDNERISVRPQTA